MNQLNKLEIYKVIKSTVGYLYYVNYKNKN